jgi:serine/threonine protein kinase
MPLESGARLGHYEVISPIAAGGMGEVYKARDPRLNRTVALKILPAHITERTELRERFVREARAIAAFNHPHICVVHDVGREGDIDFLVMEYLEGESLAERIARGPLPFDQARHRRRT